MGTEQSIFYNVKDFGAAGSREKIELTSTAGSNIYIASEIKDFKVGDSILLEGGVPRVINKQIFARTDTSPINPRPEKRRYLINGELEFLGYNGRERETYVIDLCPETPDVVRWSKDNGTSWVENVPIINNEAEIDGCKLIIHDFEDKEYGCTVVFSCISREAGEILSVNGNEIELSITATVSRVCELLHSDSDAIQRAVDLAIENSGTVYIPNGEYRLARTIRITEANGLSIVGESAAGVVIKNGYIIPDTAVDCTNGPCFRLLDCRDVSIKGVTMIGNMPFAKRHLGGCIKTTRGVEPTKVYGFYFNWTSAMAMRNVERVKIEDCHARNMSGEAFYSKSLPRRIDNVPELYQKSITYLNCSAEDCARNGFNNNDEGENTSVIGCRIVNVGGCAWEGSSRYVKFIGNYVRCAGPVAIGNLRTRSAEVERLGTAQHIVADNYFEEGVCYGGAAITVGAAAGQVIIKNNVFVNFNSNAIHLVPHSQHSDLPPEHVIITGNSIDMTAEYSPSEKRYGIRVGCDYATVSDNQIYTRGPKADEQLSCIELVGNSANTLIHSNTLSNAGIGISYERAHGFVGYVKDEKSFYRREPQYGLPGLPPVPRRRSHRFENWIIEWKSGGSSVIETCDPETKLITLKESRACTTDEEFYIRPPVPSAVVRGNILSGNIKAESFDEGMKNAVITADNLVL